MTTDPDVPIATPNARPDDVREIVLAATAALVQHLALGDRVEPGSSWPVDGADQVFSVDVSGPVDATLVLAVGGEVAEQLAADPAALAAGMRSAAEAIVATIGAARPQDDIVVGDAVRRSAAEVQRPDATVEVVSGDRVAAVVGMVGWTVQAAPGAAVDDVFVPQPFGADAHSNGAPAGPLSLLHDVDMEVTVELGRTVMPIRELLALQPGMVVEIDRAASAPIDVLVNGRRIACGEVVVIDEEFGIRITEIVTVGDVHR